MSSKNDKKREHLSTVAVDRFGRTVLWCDDGTEDGQLITMVDFTDFNTGEVRQVARRVRRGDLYLNPDGSEMVSPVSTVATVHQRPPSIGDRLARFQRVDPADDYGYDELDDDDLDLQLDDEQPLSPYETRTHEFVDRVKARKAEKISKEKEKFDAEQADKRNQLKKLLEELKDEGATPVPAPKSKGAVEPPKSS